MQIPESIQDAYAATADVIAAYAPLVAVGAGAVGTLLALVLVWRFLRTGQVHERLGTVAVTLATLFAMEGMYEVARGPLGLPAEGALIFCATFEVVMLHQGSLAAHKLAACATADVSRHMRFVWIVSAASGVIASTASSSLTEVVLRLVTPPLAAGIWYMSLYADKPTPVRQPSSWIWTPRRIGIHLGLIQPGEQDLVTVDRDRRIHRLTVTSHRLHHGSPRLAGWRRARLRRLAIHADDDMIREAQRRIARVHRIERLTSPDAPPPGEATDRDRDLMDELRRITTQATTRIRAEHRAALGVAREPLVELGGIRMPAHLAAQIGPPPEPRPTRRPAHSGGSLEALVDVVGEPTREPVSDSPADSPADSPSGSPSGSPRTAAATQRPAQRRVTERLTAGSQTSDDRRIRQAYTRLSRRLDREPSGAELAEAAGVSKATANRWKANNAPKETT